MSVLSLFRLVVMLAFTAWVCFPLLAEGETPMPPMPILPEDYPEEGDTGSEEEDTPPAEEREPVSLELVDWSSFFAHYDWSAWDDRITAWYADCNEEAIITPPLPLGARMHHSLGVEEWSPPFDILCPHLESIVFEEIQMWQVRIEEHVDTAGNRSFWTLIGNTIVHKLPVPTTFNPTAWICSLYEATSLPEWLFNDEEETAEWLSVRDRSRLAISLTLLPTGMLSTYNTLMLELAIE